MDNRFNKIFLSFFLFNYEFSLRNRLINVFPNQFSFYPENKKSNNFVKSHLTKLNNLILQASSNPQLAIIVTDASIKNQVTTSISYVYCHNRLVIKILYYAVNVTTIKAELFTIRCGINQAIYLFNIKKIFVVTDSIHTARRIFNLSSHPYQSQSAVILGELQEFFKRNNNNSIKFWNCSSNHESADKETKEFNILLILLCKSSWDFSKKSKYDSILNNWKMIFQVSNTKGYNFMNLLNKNSNPIKLYTAKDSP